MNQFALDNTKGRVAVPSPWGRGQGEGGFRQRSSFFSCLNFPGGPRIAERSSRSGHLYSGGLGKPLGRGEGGLPQRSSLFRNALCLLLIHFSVFILSAADNYKLGDDSMPHENVPHGDMAHAKIESKIFPGTVRDYWIYLPKQYDGSTPACLMVFQDGGSYMGTNGQFRALTVFDNLIHKKEMPVTIGLFVNPGEVPPAEPGQKARSNRSYEYDSLGDLYTHFLVEELLPIVEKKYKITTDPDGRAIGGISSGAICAWTVAWERPDLFHKVLSHVGSFTNIRDGNNYPALIRKSEKKPIRVFHQEMAAALKFKGYDYKFEFGDGGHNGKHGGAILPDSLRWLWRDYAKQ